MYCTLVREFAAKIFMASALSSLQLLSTTINSHGASEGARNCARLPRTTRKLSLRLYVQRITLINSILAVRLSLVGTLATGPGLDFVTGGPNRTKAAPCPRRAARMIPFCSPRSKRILRENHALAVIIKANYEPVY